jgi:hypothetical protein
MALLAGAIYAIIKTVEVSTHPVSKMFLYSLNKMAFCE